LKANSVTNYSVLLYMLRKRYGRR